MIEYVDEIHTYLYDGEIIPSVSELLRFIFPNKYSNVPEHILNAKAKYGSTIHKAIEDIEKGEVISALDYIQQASIDQYLKLKEKNDLEVVEQEKIIHYKNKYAGRFDMIANVNNKYSLCDIKTTSELDKESLSWQLSLYAYAYKDMYDEDFEKLYAIWLPKKDLGQLIEIKKKSDKEIEELIEEYYSQKNKESDYDSYLEEQWEDHKLGLI